MKYYLAIDIGASSGRHIIGYKDESNQIVLKEMYRFKNTVIRKDDHLVWDVEYLFQEVKNGIKECLKNYPKIESMSIDTWGVDYVLMNNDKEINPVYAYRDNRTHQIIEDVHNKISFEKLYSITGCQFQDFTTIYQLYDDKVNHRLDKATDYLMIPEYLMYRLTGNKVKEYTNAGTTGLYDLENLKISKEIMTKLELPKLIDIPLYKPGTVVGNFTEEIKKEVEGDIKVVLSPTHDTASAVEAIDIKNDVPYISSGTWSLLGIKVDKPINSATAREYNYSNEFGPNYFRFQKNIMGLWIIQNLAKELNLSFVEMIEKAKKTNYSELIDVNDQCFKSPISMKEEIVSYLKKNNKSLPKDDSELINCVYHSLAYSYHLAVEELESITQKKYEKIYIVGGGAKNKYLNSLTEQYTKKEVIALPIEATALGNIKSQMEK